MKLMHFQYPTQATKPDPREVGDQATLETATPAHGHVAGLRHVGEVFRVARQLFYRWGLALAAMGFWRMSTVTIQDLSTAAPIAPVLGEMASILAVS